VDLPVRESLHQDVVPPENMILGPDLEDGYFGAVAQSLNGVHDWSPEADSSLPGAGGIPPSP